MTKLTNTREDMLQKKKQEAELHKQRTAQMYDNMAKSAPAGDHKKLDTSILKTETSTTTKSIRVQFSFYDQLSNYIVIFFPFVTVQLLLHPSLQLKL